MTITGAGFSRGATIDFGSNPASDVTVNSGTSITATAPPGTAGSVDVTVTTAGGTSATGVGDLFAYGAPTVTGVSPNGGPPAGGTAVVIDGTGFAAGAAVRFGTAAATSVVVDSGTSISAVAPAGSTGSVDVTVTTDQGTSPTGVADQFEYANPSVTSVSPNAGPTAGGSVVTIVGSGFAPGATVRFGANAATGVDVESANVLTATVPSAGAGSVDVTVTTAAGTSPTSSADLFAYGAPVVTGISPNNGPGWGGTAVTITGIGIRPGRGGPVRILSRSGNRHQRHRHRSLTVMAPAGAASVDVTVTTPAGQSATTPADLFAYDVPTVSLVSPASGPSRGGTVVTIGGSGFVPGATVSFGGNPATGVTVDSSSSITATSPAGGRGLRRRDSDDTAGHLGHRPG